MVCFFIINVLIFLFFSFFIFHYYFLPLTCTLKYVFIVCAQDSDSDYWRRCTGCDCGGERGPVYAAVHEHSAHTFPQTRHISRPRNDSVSIAG